MTDYKNAGAADRAALAARAGELSGEPPPTEQAAFNRWMVTKRLPATRDAEVEFVAGLLREFAASLCGTCRQCAIAKAAGEIDTQEIP